MANSPDRGRHWKLYEFGANGEFGIQADKTISTPGIEKRRHRMDESRGRPQVAIGHMWLKVSDISRAAQYFVSLGLRPIHQGQGIAVLELRGGTHLVLRPSDESIPAGTKAPFRLDGGRHRRHTRTIRAIGPEAV